MYKDITSYNKNDVVREPRVLENKVCDIVFKVHKNICYENEWLLSCTELGIDKYELKTDDIEVAKARGIMQLVLFLQARIGKYERAVDELNSKILSNNI